MAITSLPVRRSREGTCGHGDKLRSRDGGGAGLSEPAVELSELRISVRERTARRAVPTSAVKLSEARMCVCERT